MVASPGAGVILSTDKEAIRSLFLSSSKLKKENLEKGSYFFGVADNSNLISFYSKWDFRSGEQTGQPIFELEIIDPDGKFEQEFLQLDLPSELRNRFIDSGNNNPSRGPINYDTPDGNPIVKPDSSVNLSGIEDALDRFERNRLGSPNFISPGEFYLAYGSGENLDEWAGPLSVFLWDAEMELIGGRARKIMLKFSYNDSFLSLASSLNKDSILLDVQGFGIRARGASDIITLKSKDIKSLSRKIFSVVSRQNFLRDLYGNPNDSDRPVRKNASRELFEEVDKVFDFHKIITQAIRRYLKETCLTKNAIVVIPNINFAQYDFIANKFLSTLVSGKGEKLLKSLDKSRAVKAASRSRSLGDIVFRGVDRIFDHFSDGKLGTKAVDKAVKKGAQDFYTGNPSAIAGLLLDFVSDVLTGFGLKVDTSLDIVNRSAIGRKRRESEDFEISVNAVITSDLTNDFWEPLNNVANKISQGSNTYKTSVNTIFWESDLKIISEWDKFLGSYGNEGKVIGDKTKSVVLFGHRPFMQRFLYGINFDEEKDTAAKRNESFIDRGVSRYKAFAEEETSIQLNYLHQFDFDVLFRPEMYKNIKHLVEGKDKSLLSTKLGDFYGIPEDFKLRDDFSIEDRESIQKEVIQTNMPVFRSNTENANVLELDIKLNKAFTNALRLGFQRIAQFDPFLSENDKELLGKVYFPDLDMTSIIADLRSDRITKEEAIKVFKDKISSAPLEKEDIERITKIFFERNNTAGPVVALYEQDKNNPLSIQAIILERALNDLVEATVKSLPLFKISTPYFLYRPAVLLGSQSNIIGSEQVGQDLVNSFYSGVYFIAGWEHEISRDEVSSTFTLIQNWNSQTKDKNEEIL